MNKKILIVLGVLVAVLVVWYGAQTTMFETMTSVWGARGTDQSTDIHVAWHKPVDFSDPAFTTMPASVKDLSSKTVFYKNVGTVLDGVYKGGEVVIAGIGDTVDPYDPPVYRASVQQEGIYIKQGTNYTNILRESDVGIIGIGGNLGFSEVDATSTIPALDFPEKIVHGTDSFSFAERITYPFSIDTEGDSEQLSPATYLYPETSKLAFVDSQVGDVYVKGLYFFVKAPDGTERAYVRDR